VVHTVLLEYPGGADNPKAFRFPADLEAAVNEWSHYVLQEGKAALRQSTRRQSSRKLTRKPVSALSVVRGLRQRRSHKEESAPAPHGATALSPVKVEGRLFGRLEA
jgi:hypothetical protein